VAGELTDFTFVDYEVKDSGVTMHFVCLNPGAGRTTDYYIDLTDADVAGVSTQLQLKNLIVQKLQRKLKATGFSTKLDPLIGQSVSI
jgi:hypothetical protein